MTRKILLSLMIVVLLAVAVGGWAWLQYRSFADRPMAGDGPVRRRRRRQRS